MVYHMYTYIHGIGGIYSIYATPFPYMGYIYIYIYIYISLIYMYIILTYTPGICEALILYIITKTATST